VSENLTINVVGDVTLSLQHDGAEHLINPGGKTMGSPYGTAVITGALSILGMACAHHLANEGYDLVLVDRHRHRLNVQANHLTTRTGCAVEVCEADLRDANQQSMVTEKIREDASISLIVRIDDESPRTPRELDDALTQAAADVLGQRCDGSCIYRATVIIIAGSE
jgi:NAD(P)-dependent dehydrogenase (short-subunit alcohol dehydrogenase family)